MFRSLLVPLVLLACFPAIAQTQAAPKAGSPGRGGTKAVAPVALEPVDPVEGVVTMVQAGLSDDIIIAKLRKDGKAFDLSSDQMIRLKKGNVSDAILKVMMDPRAELKPQPAAPVAIQAPIVTGLTPNPSGATPAPGVGASSDPNDPLTQHDSGIYLYTKDREGKPQMIVLERAAYQGAKTGGVLTSAMTYGIKKAKQKAVIPGARASIRTEDPAPTFYFYFDDKAAGLGKGLFGANVSNPNQFALVKLDVTKSNRETTIMEFGAFGSSSGTDSKAMAAFKSDRLRPGLYKVVPTAPLQPGEYCFLASVASAGAFGAGAMTAADLFDFGVNPNQ